MPEVLFDEPRRRHAFDVFFFHGAAAADAADSYIRRLRFSCHHAILCCPTMIILMIYYAPLPPYARAAVRAIHKMSMDITRCHVTHE